MTDESIEPTSVETVVTEEPIANVVDPAALATEAPPIEEAFDSAAFESQFGYPAGTFAGAQSADDVLAKIAENANRSIFDGLEADDADPFTEPAAPQAGENETIEELRARLAQAESQLEQNLQAEIQQRATAIERRIDAAINKFASPKYGVGANRTLAQSKAATTFKQKVLAHVASLTESDQVPLIEELAARLRQFDDDTYKPGKPMDRVAAALGTPGTSKESRGQAAAANQPRNIHEAVLRNMTV